MTDIVKRLRESAKIAWGYPGMLPWPEHGSPLPNEAADTIEALRAENARLKKENERFSKMHDEMLLVANAVTAKVKARAARGESDE